MYMYDNTCKHPIALNIHVHTCTIYMSCTCIINNTCTHPIALNIHTMYVLYMYMYNNTCTCKYPIALNIHTMYMSCTCMIIHVSILLL